MPVADNFLSEQQLADRAVRRHALARALAQARHHAGLTQESLAEASGISRPTIARLESGTASLSSDRLWDWAKACRTTPSAILAVAEADAAAAKTLEP